jgi:hypothetical protein
MVNSAYDLHTIPAFPALQNNHFTLYYQAFYQFGAGGGTRTHTTIFAVFTVQECAIHWNLSIIQHSEHF